MEKLTPPRGYNKERMQVRRNWLERRTGWHPPAFELDPPASLQGLVENHIGYMGLPMSIAGPLQISGSYARGEFYVPLCAVEGALSLSVTRGCFLTRVAGGIQTQHIRQELSRAPIFTFEGIKQAAAFLSWVDDHFDVLRERSQANTRYGRLLRIEKYPVQNRVILNFVYNTAEAAGQNMVTFATDHACKFICQELPGEMKTHYRLESNFCSDKNPAYRSLLQGRGHYVIASTEIEERLLRRILHVSVDEMIDSFADMYIGSQLAGVLGFNLNVSNVISAMYLSTGQDVASVGENAIAILSIEKKKGRLYATLSMPSLTVGTVGGATRLRQQKANLQLLGCQGPSSAAKLAEIICAACLALEISLGGAVVSHEFAQAHTNFGR